jgi:hypothetical protein
MRLKTFETAVVHILSIERLKADSLVVIKRAREKTWHVNVRCVCTNRSGHRYISAETNFLVHYLQRYNSRAVASPGFGGWGRGAENLFRRSIANQF